MVLALGPAALAVTSCRSGDGGGGGADEAGPAVPTSVASTTLERWSTPTDDPLVEELTDELVAGGELAGGASGLAEPQARCLSSSLLQRVGLDALARAGGRTGAAGGIDLAALDGDERQGFAGALLTCLDLPQVLASQLRGIEGLGPEGTACVVRRLTADGAVTDLVRRAILEGSDLRGREDELAVPMQRAFERCLSAEELDRLGGDGARPA